ncbi:MAG: 50S ribosomal protein L29 [Anaerolineales bacterium]|jgi:large subunit ribosomal protein L29|nr:50S ribosomal protein L29 [Anaerolineales bacterium]
MKSTEIRELATEEIRTRIEDSRQELMNLRFQMAVGSLTDYTRVRYTRRTIARLLTILNQREMAESQEGEA